MDHGVTLEDIVAARKRIKSYIHKTKTFTSEKFNELTKWTVFFKAENLQATGSFKVRGALNCVSYYFKFISFYIKYFKFV